MRRFLKRWAANLWGFNFFFRAAASWLRLYEIATQLPYLPCRVLVSLRSVLHVTIRTTPPSVSGGAKGCGSTPHGPPICHVFQALAPVSAAELQCYTNSAGYALTNFGTWGNTIEVDVSCVKASLPRLQSRAGSRFEQGMQPFKAATPDSRRLPALQSPCTLPFIHPAVCHPKHW